MKAKLMALADDACTYIHGQRCVVLRKVTITPGEVFLRAASGGTQIHSI